MQTTMSLRSQHFNADLLLGNFAQRGHGRLVLGVDLRRVTLRELPRAVSRRQRELEAVRDLL
jgi:hypothetical protein